MVSDGAKALIKLALSELGCASVADLFHALRALGQPLGSAIGRQHSQLKKHDSETERAIGQDYRFHQAYRIHGVASRA